MPSRRSGDRRRRAISWTIAGAMVAGVALLGWSIARNRVRTERAAAELKVARPDLRRRDPAAVDAYVQARHLWRERSRSSVALPITYYETAIDLEPTFADAYAGLASALVVLPWQGGDQQICWTRARVAATRAIQLDPWQAEAFAARAYGEMTYEWAWSVAERDFRSALALRQDEPTIHQWFADFLCGRGRCEEGLAEARRAAEIDPLSPIVRLEVGLTHYWLHHPDSAIAILGPLTHDEPRFAPAFVAFAEAQLMRGDRRAAVAAIEQAVRLVPRDAEAAAIAILAYARAGDSAQVVGATTRFRALRAAGPVSPTLIAISFLGAGDRRAAIVWLERAIHDRDRYVGERGLDPIFDPLRTDQELAKLLLESDLR